MTTAHDSKGYMLRNRRRPKESSLIRPETRRIFDIPHATNMLGTNVRIYHLSKLALPVIVTIDDYNWNIGEVNIHDQLQEDLLV
jgi:hypothetical protein